MASPANAEDRVTSWIEFEQKLVERLQECIPKKNKDTGCYIKAVSHINWDEVAFGGRSAEECRECWTGIQARLRLHRTLGDLLDDAQAFRWNIVRVRHTLRRKLIAEGGLKYPGDPSMLYARKKLRKMMRKHPDMSQPQLIALLKRKFSGLSEEGKRPYREQAEVAAVQYQSQLEDLERAHPELTLLRTFRTFGPPRKPPDAVQLYVQEQHGDGVTVRAAREAYRALSVQERRRYEERARHLHERYQAAVQAYRRHFPGWRVTDPREEKEEEEEEAVEVETTAPMRPMRRPLHGVDVFRREVSAKLDNHLSATERLEVLSERWAKAPVRTRARCQRIAGEHNTRYQAYLDTLPAERRAELHALLTRNEAAVNGTPTPRRVRRVAAREAYVREKMPADLGVLTEKDWRSILFRKFAKLTDAEKKGYEARAAELTVTDRAQAAAEAQSEASAQADQLLALSDAEDPDWTPDGPAERPVRSGSQRGGRERTESETVMRVQRETQESAQREAQEAAQLEAQWLDAQEAAQLEAGDRSPFLRIGEDEDTHLYEPPQGREQQLDSDAEAQLAEERWSRVQLQLEDEAGADLAPNVSSDVGRTDEGAAAVTGPVYWCLDVLDGSGEPDADMQLTELLSMQPPEPSEHTQLTEPSQPSQPSEHTQPSEPTEPTKSAPGGGGGGGGEVDTAVTTERQMDAPGPSNGGSGVAPNGNQRAVVEVQEAAAASARPPPSSQRAGLGVNDKPRMETADSGHSQPPTDDRRRRRKRSSAADIAASSESADGSPKKKKRKKKRAAQEKEDAASAEEVAHDSLPLPTSASVPDRSGRTDTAAADSRDGRTLTDDDNRRHTDKRQKPPHWTESPCGESTPKKKKKKKKTAVYDDIETASNKENENRSGGFGSVSENSQSHTRVGDVSSLAIRKKTKKKKNKANRSSLFM